jgi:TolA-binding protein
LASYVESRVSDARIDAQWSRIAERLPAPKPQRRPTFVLAGAVAALGALAVVALKDEPHGTSAWEGSVVSSDEAPVEMTLGEGSFVELSPRSEVQLLQSTPEQVKLDLNAGSARFAISEDSERRFMVRSGPVEIVVTGTQFRLSRELGSSGERVRVDVEEGAVEVHRRDAHAAPVRLAAGEHWSTFVAFAADQTFVKATEREADTVAVETPEASVDGLDRPESKGQRGRRRQGDQTRAAALFEQANVARRAGQLRDAAGLYAELVDQYPKDRRAALSAFELGRIRMDTLRDMAGAVQAFERSLDLDGRRGFAEDALARLSLAHESLGDAQRCRTTRERYLLRYPEGVHAASVAKRCPGP